MPVRVGVVAIQGDFDKHLEMIRQCGAEGIEVRTPDDLVRADRLILPGGESTTVGLLMERYGLGQAIQERADSGMPVWGTCMGMILMAREVEGRDQYRLGLLDVAVKRNAFGAQVHSFEDELVIEGLPKPVTGVFIRAPVVVQAGPSVQPIGWYGDKIVAVRSGFFLGTSFHPELTNDPSLHEWFLSW